MSWNINIVLVDAMAGNVHGMKKGEMQSCKIQLTFIFIMLSDIEVASDVKNLIDSLKSLADLNGRLQHQFKEPQEGKWRDSIQTYFIYSFFTFNGLYSVNWEKSIKQKRVVYWSDGNGGKASESSIRNDTGKMSEVSCIKKLIDFSLKRCSSDKLQELRNQMLKNWTSKDVILLANAVLEDNSKLGSIQNEYVDKNKIVYRPIQDYQTAVNSFMSTEMKNPIFDIQQIAIFIYKIRCNIFHGVKCLEELAADVKWIEQDKLKWYTDFLNALNMFCLNRLKDLCEESFRTESRTYITKEGCRRKR